MSSDRETATEEMRRYVRFDEADGAAVAALRERATPHLSRIAASFYDRIREHEDAHAVFRDEAQVQRLHQSMVRWLAALFSGDYGPAHFASTAQIGKVHVRIGLPQRYMHTAMALIRAELVDVVAPAASTAAVASLHKLVDLELAVMVEAYCDDFATRLRQLSMADSRAALLEAPEQHYVRVMERARVLMVGIDGRGCVRLFNREAERATGWARDEALGRPATSLLFTQEHVSVVEHRLSTVAEGDDVFFDANLENRHGHRRDLRWQLLRTSPATAEADRVQFFLVGHDVTDELALAARIRRAERLAAVGTLATGLAHEIRNPLNGAHLHLTVLERALKRGEAGTEARQALATASAEIQRLGNLVTDFLQFARPQRFELAATPLDDVVQRAVAAFVPEARQHGIALDLALPLTPVVVLGDAQRLEQVVSHLVRNAIEASQAGAGSRVAVRVFRTPASGTVEVEDDGPGLPSPDAPIFDAFFTTKPSGTGLGLSIAHRITEDHGGRLSVDDTQGRTVFRLALPRADHESQRTPGPGERA
jgi:PAS domain S-box-containing protein